MNAVETEIDLEKLVDLDKAIPCQALDTRPFIYGGGGELNCLTAAEWERTYSCCGTKRTYCVKHMEEAINIDYEGRRWVCLRCRNKLDLGRWRRL